MLVISDLVRFTIATIFSLVNKDRAEVETKVRTMPVQAVIASVLCAAISQVRRLPSFARLRTSSRKKSTCGSQRHSFFMDVRTLVRRSVLSCLRLFSFTIGSPASTGSAGLACSPPHPVPRAGRRMGQLVIKFLPGQRGGFPLA